MQVILKIKSKKNVDTVYFVYNKIILEIHKVNGEKNHRRWEGSNTKGYLWSYTNITDKIRAFKINLRIITLIIQHLTNLKQQTNRRRFNHVRTIPQFNNHLVKVESRTKIHNNLTVIVYESYSPIQSWWRLHVDKTREMTFWLVTREKMNPTNLEFIEGRNPPDSEQVERSRTDRSTSKWDKGNGGRSWEVTEFL